MNRKQLLALGVPADCVPAAIAAVQQSAMDRTKINPKKLIPQLIAAPDVYLAHSHYAELAQAVIAEKEAEAVRPTDPIPHAQFGSDFDAASIQQIENACRLPIATAAALMPDAHCGYGLPIGGVLACDNAVVPYGVCLLYTSPSPRDRTRSRMPSSA